MAFQMRNTNARVSKINTQLDAAKNALRRKGCIVYDEEVVKGRSYRGLVRVDNKLCKPEEVLALAAGAP